MPIKTNLNVSPYFDDFDEAKNFHRILFRPQMAVQARELTQLQSILQNQIERFGNWAFQNGDIVEGCSINDLPVVPYVFLADDATLANATSANVYDISAFVNCIAVSTTSNLHARILYANTGLQTNYPNTNIIYLNYINTGNNTNQRFGNNELLQIYSYNPTTNSQTLVANVYTIANVAGTNASGNAHGITVSEGICYLSGSFVRVPETTFGLVNSHGTYAGNNVVGFQAIETIVTENQDESLLDNSLGYPNENAPGAHRLKILPGLVSLDPEIAASTKGFNPIAVYNYGALVNKDMAKKDIHSVVQSALSNRTYEESGNYVVNPFIVDTVTDSGDTNVAPADSDHLLAKINPGVGYSMGSRVTLDKAAYVNMRRGIDTQTNEAQNITFAYGGYFTLKECSGSFEFDRAQTVGLYDEYQKAVTDRQFASLTPQGNFIGTAMVRCFTYSGGGNPGTNNAIYLLHVFNVDLVDGYNINQVKSVHQASGSSTGVGDLSQTGLISTGSKDLLFFVGTPGVKNLRSANNARNTKYISRIKTEGTIGTDGFMTISVTGGNQQLPYGAGILSDSISRNIIVVPTANSYTDLLPGKVNISSATNVVNAAFGYTTTFFDSFSIGDVIYVNSERRTVTAILDDSNLTVDAPFSTTLLTGLDYQQFLPAGKQITTSMNSPGISGYVQVSNTTSMTFYTAKPLVSPIPVNITYDIEKIRANPQLKSIRKHRFVKIDTSSNKKGPWCLGFADVHKVRAVYGGSDENSYSTSNPDVTSAFYWHSGQSDTYYGLAYLYAKSDSSISSNPYLLVELDYFETSTSAGVGFYSVESYPIDDVHTANNYAIQTKDIPLYVDEKGRKLYLRDFVDFRPICDNMSNDTGDVDTANSVSLSLAIGNATTNPNDDTVFAGLPGSGIDVPSYGQNMETDYTVYLPRKDVVFITPDNVIKTKEGVSRISPQTPIYPDNGMVIAEVYVPPYPSLTSDQITSMTVDNRASTSLCRETSTRTLVNLLSNRRYTMQDIGKLDKRITNLEYYTQLSLLETQAKDTTVTDVNGLDRFKNGIFVEPFSDFALADVSNPEYNMAIDMKKGVGRPKIIREIINLEFKQALSTNVQKTGRCITLPYTEEAFLTQPYATKYRSASHVAFAWVGTLTLYPSYNNHTDLNQTDAVNMTVDTARPWQDFANSPFGYTWGDWVTTTNTVATSVITGSVDTYNFNLNYGWQASPGLPAPNLTKEQLYNILTYNGITPSSDFVIGTISNAYTSALPADVLGVPGISGARPGGGGGDNGFALAWAIGWANGWW